MTATNLRVWLGNGLVLLALAAIVGWLGCLHAGAWWSAPTPHRWQLAGLGLTLYLGMCTVVLLRARRRVGAQRADASGVLIVWASQTGFARELAERSVAALQSAGVGAYALPLDAVDVDQLTRVRGCCASSAPPAKAMHPIMRKQPSAIGWPVMRRI